MVDEQSHFGGLYEVGMQHHSELSFYDADSDALQIVSARESNAYPDSSMSRAMAIIRPEGFDGPIVVDLMRVQSEQSRQYDLPFYYLGQLLEKSFDAEYFVAQSPLGSSAGYEHILLEARGTSEGGSERFSWLRAGRFYTLTTATEVGDQLLLGRIGGSDPDLNLRRDPAFILRRPAARNALFATVLEPHGSYSPVTELAIDSVGQVNRVKVLRSDDEYSVIAIFDQRDRRALFVVANRQFEADATHQIEDEDVSLSWTGPYHWSGFIPFP